MSDAIINHSLPNTRIRRKKIKRKVHRIRISSFTIFALLTSIAGGGRFAVLGGRRVVLTGGLLNRITGPSRTGSCNPASSRLDSRRAIYGTSFVTAVPLTPSFSRSSSSSKESSAATANNEKMSSESCNAEKSKEISLMSTKVTHPDDPSLWLYHVESTSSTMDASKTIVENKFLDADNPSTNDGTVPTSFVVSATSQTNGRGTTQRNWKSSQKGNALFTIGIQQSSWMKDLKAKNGGRMVPLTLLPLKIGSLVAFHIQRALEECALESGEKQQIPRVTVKWPNDVLIRRTQIIAQSSSSPSAREGHEKIAGVLIESARDWFLIGIGINVGYAPSIPSKGADYGRRATCLSQYCNASTSAGEIDGEGRSKEEEEYWINMSKKLAIDIAHDLHSWLHSTPSTLSLDVHSGESVLNQWKSYIDWDMELTLRDTPKRERVTLKSVMHDGRVVVQEVETGVTRTLITDYFL